MKQGELYYTGTIVEITDPLLYVIKVDIPGVKEGVTAFPTRGEVDEPRVGDFVILRCFDPVFQSYYLYQKIKENDFIGFRSRGKMVDITPEYIQIGIYDPSNDEWNDKSENTSTDELGRVQGGYRPEVTDWMRLDKNGNLNVYLRNNARIDISGNEDVHIVGNLNITVEGDAKITVEGSTTLKSPDVVIKGPGVLTCKGITVPSAEGGPFCAFKVAPPAGTPMVSGYEVMLTDYEE